MKRLDRGDFPKIKKQISGLPIMDWQILCMIKAELDKPKLSEQITELEKRIKGGKK